MKLIYILFFLLSCHNSFAQTTITGVVIDSLTSEPMPFVKVFHKPTTTGVITNFNGEFILVISKATDSIQFSYVGYKTVTISAIQTGEVLIKLNSSTQLDVVEVVSSRKNPAFIILKEVNNHRKQNDSRHLAAYESEIYNKIQVDLANLDSNFEDNKMIKQFDFIGEYADTLKGHKYLPILLSESVSNYYYRNNPDQKKEIIVASKITGFKNLNLTEYTGSINQKINVYDHFIRLFNKDFLSPIANTSRSTYIYYYTGKDTIDNEPCYHLIYTPRRKGESALIGDIWITTKTYAVKKVTAKIPNNVNLNYVSAFEIEQNYSLIDTTVWMLTNEIMFAELNYFNDTKQHKIVGANVRKTSQVKNIVLNQPKKPNFYLQNLVVADSADIKSDDYWEKNRQTTLSKEESGIIEMSDSLFKNKLFNFYDDLTYMAYTGFWKVNKIEVGNIYSLYNNNPIEGHKFRLDLRTSNEFSKKHEISAFGAYGLKDEDYKYGMAYRIRVKNSPREMLRFAYSKRINQLGISSKLANKSSSLVQLFSNGPLENLTMVNKASISFEKDYKINLRTFNSVELKKYIPVGIASYNYTNTTGDTIGIDEINSFEIVTQIVYTKEEMFISGNFDRTSTGSLYPVISLSHTLGLSNVLNSQYDFNKFEFYINHNARVGFWGQINYRLYAGKIYGTLPYPFLNVHAGNQSFFLQREAFNLMNYFEFVSDTWVGLNFEHKLQGLILDRIPLVRKLKLRTIYTVKAVVGDFDARHLTKMNLPNNTNKLSYTKPYVEVNVGVDNIFKYIRIDAIWRLTYLDSEDASNFGVKFMFTGNF
jgi:hypothetical protein